MSNYSIEGGFPSPLGASKQERGLNFALAAEHASTVKLCLFTPKASHPFLEVPLQKTDGVWHVLVRGLPPHIEYGYLVDDSKVLLSDPYATALNAGHLWGERPELYRPRGEILREDPFDWEGDKPLNLSMEELIIYEMHVRSFTKHPSSHVAHPGTYLGMIEKIPYLKKLGINAVELLPVYEFNECEYDKPPLLNVWGYSTVNFFTPMTRFATSSSIREFKLLVKELHKQGIEVILDVVFNHTAEGGKTGPTLSFKGIDRSVYYMLDDKGEYLNFSGTGNTFNCNHPTTAKFILDALRYWVTEMHVDGFRFDLASILTRDEKGAPMEEPPVILAMRDDPVLSKTKLIAEAWDAGGLYQVGTFPKWGKWYEWNGRYRDVVRKFIKGMDGLTSAFATALCGSQDLYGQYGPKTRSINFIIAHDGFTLKDLVSYDKKHNEANRENNQDGANDNESWNCGAEGETKNHKVLSLRQRQMRNFHTALMVSLGTPMMLMGDEYGHTCLGNNNVWCQDNALNWFLWDQHPDFFRFYLLMIQFRKKHPSLQSHDFPNEGEIEWHGHKPNQPDWSPASRFVAYTFKKTLYIAFNAHFHDAPLELPPPPSHQKWYRIVDTGLPSPSDFLENPKERPPLKFTYSMLPNSALILQAM
jgi:isoamylase